jgi:hypothetical protein
MNILSIPYVKSTKYSYALSDQGSREKSLQVPMLQCFLAGSHEEACCSQENLCCLDSRTID